jgi:hypothetical protein
MDAFALIGNGVSTIAIVNHRLMIEPALELRNFSFASGSHFAFFWSQWLRTSSKN